MKDTKPSHDLIDKALIKHKSIAVYGLFSGGHDSLTACHVASKHPKFSGCVHINTGIGVAQTRQFVIDTCKREGWPLRIIRAKEDCGQDYREMVLEHGFPGPPMHSKMYNRLKERAIRLLLRETKVGKKHRDSVILISGVRSAESVRRMGYVEPLQKDGSKIWVAVIHDWTKQDCNAYIDGNNLKRNEVVDMIHKSGECLCGAYAKKGELDELAVWFPEVAKEIRDLEKEVHARGHKWGWGERAYMKKKIPKDPKKSMLCSSCEYEGSEADIKVDVKIKGDIK